MTWQVLIPVKPLTNAKTRIDVDPGIRGDLALAMCMDVLTAALDSSLVAKVHVITVDQRMAAAARTTDARAWSVPGRRGLNAELSRAMGSVRTAHGVAIVMADLPCLTTDVFTDILAAAPTTRPSFVPDAADRGTTMLLNPPSVRMTPSFGDRSAHAHGATATKTPPQPSWLPARRDVDTLDDLVSAARIGLGAHTLTLWEQRLDHAHLSGNRTEVPGRTGQCAGEGARTAML